MAILYIVSEKLASRKEVETQEKRKSGGGKKIKQNQLDVLESIGISGNPDFFPPLGNI